MPDSTLTQEKKSNLHKAVVAKENVLNQKTLEKQGNTVTNNMLNKLQQEQKLLLAEPQDSTTYLEDYDENVAEGFYRGGKEAVEGMGNLGFGVAAGVGAIGESAFGEGGFSTQLKEAAVEKYVQGQQKMTKNAELTDSFTYSYDQAKQGNIKALFDWTIHGLGYTTAQLATMLMGAGVIGKGVELTGKGVIKRALSGMVDKEVNRMVAQGIVRGGQQVGIDILHKQAVATVTKQIGMHAGMASMGTGMEFGEIMGGLAEQSTQRPEGEQVLSGKEIGKGLLATGAAGAVEYAETLLGLKALKGKLPGVSGNTVSGMKGRALRAGISAGEVAPAEGVQEYVQTGLEQWGQGQDLSTEEAKRERVDAGMLGTLSSGSAAVGGAVSSSTNEQVKAARKKANKKLSTPETAFGYKDKVSTVAESGNTSEYTDPKKDTYSPGIAVAGLKEQNMAEGATTAKKVETYDEAAAIVDTMKTELNSIKEEFAIIEAKGDNLNEKDSERVEYLMSRSDALLTLEPKLDKMLESMKADKTKAPELMEQLRTMVKESNDEGAINTVKEMFGSHGGAYLGKEDSIALDDIIGKPDIAPEVRETLKQAKAYINSSTIVQKASGKSMAAVSQGIKEGDKHFVGTDQYMQDIGSAPTAKVANAKLAKLKEFASGIQLKAETFQTIYDSEHGGPIDATAARAQLKKINEANVAKGLEPYDIHRGSTKLVNQSKHDAAVVQAAVDLGNTLVHGPSKSKETASQRKPPSVSSGTQNSSTQSKTTPNADGMNQPGEVAPPTPKQSGAGTGQPKVADSKYDNMNVDQEVVDEDNYTGSQNQIVLGPDGQTDFTKVEPELFNKLKDKLQKLYPGIKLSFTSDKRPKWGRANKNIFNQESEIVDKVLYAFKAIDLLQSDKAKQIFTKGKKNKWDMTKILTEVGIPKDQKQMLLSIGITDREQLIVEFGAKYNFEVKVDTAKQSKGNIITNENGKMAYDTSPDNFEPTNHYGYLTVPGGVGYTENEVSTPLITPVIKGHAEFSTDQGIGWFRSDIEVNSDQTDPSTTRRILEVQSDLFQKARTLKDLISDDTHSVIGYQFFDLGKQQEFTVIDYKKAKREDPSENPDEDNWDDWDPINEEMIKPIDDSITIKYVGESKTVIYEYGDINRLLNNSISNKDNNKLTVLQEIVNKDKNQFLKLLLNKGNWVTFFIKSIVQDSAKKGYNKVLFPTGETAAKVEGHDTLAVEAARYEKMIADEQKEVDRLKKHGMTFKEDFDFSGTQLSDNIGYDLKSRAGYRLARNATLHRISIASIENQWFTMIDGVKNVISEKEAMAIDISRGKIWYANNRIKSDQEHLQRLKTEGVEKLKPIEAFYENRVTSILNKQFGKTNINQVTDTHGNTWNEVTINQDRDLSDVLLQKNAARRIIGQADTKAKSVLIHAAMQKQDTLPHEYAHHYISYFRDTPIVQEGIKRFGSEEALVQAIGEQVVRQKGEAYNWWKRFTNWVLTLLSDKEVLQILTDSFLTRANLNESKASPLPSPQGQEPVSPTGVAEAKPSTQPGKDVGDGPAANEIIASRLPNLLTAKKLKKNVTLLLQHFPNLLDQLREAILSKTPGIFTKKNPHDGDAQILAEAINRFGRKFEANHNQIFKPKYLKTGPLAGEIYTKADPIQHFVLKDSGKLSPAVVNAMMAASFKFIAAQGSTTLYNDTRAMKGILNIPNAEDVSDTAKQLLTQLGTHQDYLKNQIGQDIFDMLKVNIDPKAAFDFKERLVSSLGLQAIATMQHMRLLTETKVITGTQENSNVPVDKVTVGLTGLTNEQTDPDKKKFKGLEKNFFVDPKAPTRANLERQLNAKDLSQNRRTEIQSQIDALKGKGTISFYKIASENKSNKDETQVPHWAIRDEYMTPFNGSRHTWDLIFKGEVSKKDYSWGKFTFEDNERFRTKKAGGLLTEEQTQRLITNMNIPYTANAPVMNAFYFLGSDQRADILGYTGDKPAHITMKDTNKGVDLGIDRSIEAVDNWLIDASQQELGTDSPFYIPAEPWKQERMGQVSSITTQGDKLHRSLFNMASWKHTVSLKKDGPGNDQYYAFMLGVGMYLDIEFTKKGGIKKTVDLTEDLMATDKMVKAIKALQKLQTKLDANPVIPGQAQTDLMTELGEQNPEDQAAIVAAVKKGDVKAQSLKALVEYAAYKTAKDAGATEFETNMTIEIDGTANGPAFGRWQLMREEVEPLLHLAALQTSGFRFHENKEGIAPWDLSEHLAGALNHDAYQITGFENALTLVNTQTTLNEQRNDPAKEEWKREYAYRDLSKMEAIIDLLGSPIDPKTGNVSKDMRKISKGPTMKTMYGMGKKKLTLELINTIIEKTHKDLAKLADSKKPEDRQRLKDIDYSIRVLTGEMKGYNGHKVFTLGEGLINLDKVNIDTMDLSETLNIKLSDNAIAAIHAQVTNHEGPALYKAIEQVFSPIKTSADTVNKSLSMATAYYNVMRKAKIGIAINEKWEAAKKAEVALAKAELRKVKTVARENVFLTVAELKKISDGLEDIFPRVTAVNGNKMPIASVDKSKEYKEGHDVIQQYQAETKGKAKVGQKKAYSQQYDRLEDPGVSGVVLMIQMMDAAVANRLMEHFEFLNNHDGFTIGANMGAELSDKANEIFMDVNANYSIAGAAQELLETSKARFLIHAKEIGMDVDEALYQELKELSIGQEWDKETSDFVPMSKADMFMAEDKTNEANKNTNVQLNIERNIAGTKLRNIAHRDILSGKLLALSQYAYASREYLTGNKPAEEIFGIKPADITRARTKQLQEIIGLIQGKQDVIDKALAKNAIGEEPDNLLGSRKKSTFDYEKAKWDLVEEVNELNVVDMYNTMKSDSTVKDSADHDNYLKEFLGGIVQKVMKPVRLHMIKNGYAESEGKFAFNPDDKNDVFITSQITAPVSGALTHGIRMSTGEVYAHEIAHAITYYGLRANQGLQNKVSVLYDLALKKVKEAYPDGDGYRLFLSRPGINVNDPASAVEVQEAKDRFDYFLGTGQTRTETVVNPTTKIESSNRFSNHLEEFVAFGATNENFGNFLKTIEMSRSKYTQSSWGEIKGDNIQQTLINIFQKIMDFWTGTIRGTQTETTVNAELMALVARLGEVDSRYKDNLINKVSDKLDPITKQVYDKGNQWIKNAFTSMPITRLSVGLHGMLESRKDSDSILGQLMRDLAAQWSTLDEGIAKSVVTEAKGETERLGKMYQLLNRAAVFIDGARTTTSDNMQAAANEAFIRNRSQDAKKHLTSDDKMSIAKALLKTDATVLNQLLPKGDLLKVLQSTAKLQKTILDTIKEIRDTSDGVDLTEFADYYKAAADAAGHRMATGTGRKNELYFRSNKVIVEGLNTRFAGKMSPEQMAKADNLVSKLTSLYALQYTPVDHKTTAAKLMAEDETAVIDILSLHSVLKEQAKDKAFDGNEYLMEKGYTKELLNTRISYMYGTASDAKEMRALGYKMGEHPVGRDDSDQLKHIDMYIYTSRTGRLNDYAATITGFQRNSSKGTSTRDLNNQLDIDSVEGAKNKKHIINQKMLMLDNMTKPGFTPGDIGNMMDPIVDGLGNITDYRYTMSESTKDSILEKVNDYDIILGSMASQVIGKERTPIINSEVVMALKELYAKEYKANPEAYLEIGPNSTDPKLLELYHTFPDQMKADIRGVWGKSTMWVAKDVMTLAFGYRQYTAMEVFTKDPSERNLLEKVMVETFNIVAIPFGSTGITALKNTEDFLSGITSYAKNTIVVKTGFITMGNMASNLMNLKMKDIPTMEILKKSREALVMGNKYAADKKRLDKKRLRLAVAINQKGYTKNIENEIMRLENSIARNPVTEAMESGMLPSLMDAVDTSVSKDRHPHPFQKAVDKQVAKLHPVIAGAGKQLLMTEDTQAYKVLNNAVKMTDFVGRYVLYTYLVETKKMDKAKAAAQAIEEFINFAPPTHQMIDYLNRMGVLWFTKYGIRVLKTMKNNVVDKPFSVLMALGSASAMGVDTIFGSIPGVSKDLFSNVGNPVSMFLNSFGESIPLAGTDAVFKSLLGK